LEAMRHGTACAAERGRAHIHFNDQDVLNLWLATSGQGVRLPSRYNRFELGRFFEEGDWMGELVAGARHDGAVHALHFIGPDKPWQRRCPATPGVRLYARSLRAARALLSRVRDAAVDVPP
jgi:lipopolysaccharide biosynthesis glycosyltransferase